MTDPVPASKDATPLRVVTFGCRLNSYESEVMRRHAEAAGLGDVVIINTCSVTAEAVRQAGQAIRRARRDYPDATLLVSGCAAQIDPEKFADMAEVDFVIGNAEKLKAETYTSLKDHADKIQVGDIMEARDAEAPFVRGYEGLARAFVSVQNGCDNRCTFCVIPYGRGPSRSVTADRAVDQVRLLVEEEGYNEIVLTGVDIASYGQDLGAPVSLGRLLKDLFQAVPSLPRLRLSSLDPAAIDDDLWDLLANEPRLMPHWHLSLQAGDDLVLKRMKRRHNRGQVMELCARAKKLRPDMVFGADIIAGFPTETEEHFANTLDLVDQCGLTWLHVFAYSARKGTPASKMPQVPSGVRHERAARLRDLGGQMSARHYESLAGQNLSVLVEQKGLGCTPGFAKIRIPEDAQVGAVVDVTGIGRVDGVERAVWPLSE